MKKLLAGVGALLAIAAILVGIPWLIVVLAGDPFPTAEQWHAIVTLTPDYGLVITFTKLLPLLCWAVWAVFAFPFLIELIAAATHRPTHRPAHRIALFRPQQKAAATLVGAIIVMFAGGGAALAVPSSASAAETHAASTVSSAVNVVDMSQAVAAAQAAGSAAASTPAPTVRQDITHVVVPGDTLWDIAATYYGSGERYPEIVAASQGVQPDGRVMTDPNFILPGWVMTVPGVEVSAPTAPAPTPAPAPAPDAGAGASAQAPATSPGAVSDQAPGAVGGGAGGTAQTETPSQTEQQHPSQDTAEPASEVQDTGDELDVTIPLMTAGGIAGLLATGLLVAVGGRRLQQRRRRAKGERIALPDPEVADLELEMRMVENPIGVADVDNTLRTLQAWAEDTGQQLPELLAVRVAGDEVALYLAAPANLPAPFESQHEDGTAWIVRPGMAQPPARPTVSPYPALATIGTDPQGGYLLLDLEQIGSLNVLGDEETARGMLNALACEFATNPWSDQIQVTLVGLDSSLARDLDRFRIHEVADIPALVRNLRADLEDRRSALDSYGVGGVLEARSQATDLESWAPHIVILGESPVGSLRDDLAELVARMPRLGIATIAQGDTLTAGATIEARSPQEAEYRSGGALPPLPFRPQLLSGEELELVRSLFDTTALQAQPADLQHEQPHPETTAAPEAAAPLLESRIEDIAAPTGEGDLDIVDRIHADTALLEQPSTSAPQPDVDQETPAERPELDAPVERSINSAEEPDAVPAGLEEDSPAITADVDTVPDWPAPYIRLLGPVDALNIADPEALPGRGLEFLAFLLLRNGPVPGALVQKKLWPDTVSSDNNNARQLAKPTRRALGHDPEGNLLLPEGRSNAGFTVHASIRTDWQDFCDLIGPDLRKTSNENLVRAIRLVRGQPFDGIRRGRGWWAWRGPIEETMRAAILDAADELTHRAISAGELDDARLGARIAQSADPLNEAGWRLEIETAIAAGDVDAFNRIVDSMYEIIGTDFEVDDATQQLLDDAHAALPGLSSR